jgi:hypothetical protein
MFPFNGESLQWRGTNFSELYEWLTTGSISKNFKLKILEPGNRTSPLEITIEDLTLFLRVDDWIVRTKNGFFYVVEDDE